METAIEPIDITKQPTTVPIEGGKPKKQKQQPTEKQLEALKKAQNARRASAQANRILLQSVKNGNIVTTSHDDNDDAPTSSSFFLLGVGLCGILGLVYIMRGRPNQTVQAALPMQQLPIQSTVSNQQSLGQTTVSNLILPF